MNTNFDFEIEQSKDGLNILKVFKDDKKVYIGSKYKMQEQINKFINDQDEDVDEESIFIIFGVGSGECLTQFCKKYFKNKIIIFEPNIKLIEFIKINHEKYMFLKNENVYLLNCDEEGLYESLKAVISEYEVGYIKYKFLLNYDKIYGEQLLNFNRNIKKLINDKVINRNTNLLFSETWFTTLMNNLKYIINSIPINIFENKFKDIPAIIVSAGPSLEKNIKELKKIDNDMLILSGGRTLKPLVKHNIEPNLIGVVDPGETSYNLVKGYIDKCKAPLLYYEGTNSDVVKYHKDNKIIFTQSTTINKIFNMDIKNLSLGGSIAHTLTMAAIELGCNPIIFIGQDLAYTGEKYHADIAINQFKDIKENTITNNLGIYVEDINGDKVRTSEVLDGFKREMEQIIKNNGQTTFINATEGGAKIKGTIQIPLKDVINKYKLNKNIYFNVDENNKINENTKENVVKMLDESLKAAEYIVSKSKKALRTVENLRINLITNKSKINRDLKVLDKIDDEIKEKYQHLEILNSLIYPVVYTILSSKNVSNSDKDIIEKNKFLYKAILDIVSNAIKPIKDVLKELKENNKFCD